LEPDSDIGLRGISGYPVYVKVIPDGGGLEFYVLVGHVVGAAERIFRGEFESASRSAYGQSINQ